MIYAQPTAKPAPDAEGWWWFRGSVWNQNPIERCLRVDKNIAIWSGAVPFAISEMRGEWWPAAPPWDIEPQPRTWHEVDADTLMGNAG